VQEDRVSLDTQGIRNLVPFKLADVYIHGTVFPCYINTHRYAVSAGQSVPGPEVVCGF
jgi:hypothetical protein